MIKIKNIIVYFIISFIFFIEIGQSSCTISSPCCCNNTILGEKRCYTSGGCCRSGLWDENWDENGCRDFNVWVQPKRIMLTLGTKTSVILYVENAGDYTDAYDVDYEINYPNPNLIKVDLTSVTPTGDVASGYIKYLYPRITILSTTGTFDLIFNVTSRGDPNMYRTTSLVIMESDYPLSLSEFSILGLIEIIILVFTIYFINCIH